MNIISATISGHLYLLLNRLELRLAPVLAGFQVVYPMSHCIGV